MVKGLYRTQHHTNSFSDPARLSASALRVSQPNTLLTQDVGLSLERTAGLS